MTLEFLFQYFGTVPSCEWVWVHSLLGFVDNQAVVSILIRYGWMYLTDFPLNRYFIGYFIVGSLISSLWVPLFMPLLETLSVPEWFLIDLRVVFFFVFILWVYSYISTRMVSDWFKSCCFFYFVSLFLHFNHCMCDAYLCSDVLCSFWNKPLFRQYPVDIYFFSPEMKVNF